MKSSKDFHRRHLPHYYPDDAVLFITFRLAGSLPHSVIQSIAEDLIPQRKAMEERKDWKHRFTNYDRALEKAKEHRRWLSDERIADMVTLAIQYQDGKDYDLAAYCVMPNHVHLVIGTGNNGMFEPVEQTRTLSGKTVSQIMHSLKRYTAREANKILGRAGPFWQDESYDHVIRGLDEFDRIILYVLDNPVKARLAKRWEDWKWSYSRFHLRQINNLSNDN